MARRSSRLSRIPAASPAPTRLQNSCVEVQRIFAEGLVQRAAGFHFGLDVQQQLAHGRVAVTLADDVEGLQQRHAGFHHGGELAGEQGDVLVGDLAAQAGALALDLEDLDALAAQGGLDHGLAARAHVALDESCRRGPGLPRRSMYSLTSRLMAGAVAVAMVRSPQSYSLVTASTSSSEVTPCLTLSRPDWRRSRTPSRCACSAMSMALPFFMMMRLISSLMGITW